MALATTGHGAPLLASAARHAAEIAALRPLHTRAEPYARSVFHSTDQGEVMLAAWRRGGLAAPHDHGLARGFVVLNVGRRARLVAFDSGALAPGIADPGGVSLLGVP